MSAAAGARVGLTKLLPSVTQEERRIAVKASELFLKKKKRSSTDINSSKNVMTHPY